MAALTVKQLRELIAELPDDAKILPDFDGPAPDDTEPGVSLGGFAICDIGGGPYLSVKVSLFYLNEDEHEADYDWTEDLRAGDEVEWTDPDNGECSRILEIATIEIRGNVFSIVTVEGDSYEGFLSELS
jgi:hypothetical protein